MPPRRIIRPPYPTRGVVDAAWALPAFLYAGDRRYVRNLSLTLREIPQFSLSEAGYSDKGQKWNQLQKFYINEAEIERALELLAKRQGMDVTSVSISMRGQDKGSDSQGWCLETMVISRTSRETHVSVFWRSSEIVKKLAADFLLLRHVFERLSIQPASIHMCFATAWLGMTFAPLLYRTGDLVESLDALKPERTMWMSATNLFGRFLGGHEIKYAPEIRMRKFLHDHWSEGRIEVLREYLRDNGRPPCSGLKRDASNPD
jgi:hypothetical protein